MDVCAVFIGRSRWQFVALPLIGTLQTKLSAMEQSVALYLSDKVVDTENVSSTYSVINYPRFILSKEQRLAERRTRVCIHT